MPSHDTSGDPYILDFSVSGHIPLAVQLMSNFGDISEDGLRTLNFVQHVTATLIFYFLSIKSKWRIATRQILR